jgi:intracellular septation protein A
MTAMAETAQIPSVRSVLRSGAPRFVREAFGPIGAFYLGWKLGNLATGIALSTGVALALEVYEHRHGRRGTLALVSGAFVVVQGVVGLLANSAVVYLAQPVVVSAIWGVACIVSAAIGRPLLGVFADAWYPFPDDVRKTRTYKRIFGVESVVWGLYYFARSGIRMLALWKGGIGFFVVVQTLTGIPFTIALIVWSIRYSVRGFERALEHESEAERGDAPEQPKSLVGSSER